ncbi:hypothetical protein [Celeribacter ethanolicus]|uniref:hypothetical protein n=1 Tax=Celeribacter ethanolicus TaxID=1758178 RepID=UPI0008322A83|nr:hypothetical protein [Celeribacter ethanolicus]TNE68993.1 MAG: hypothetical protein EP336_03215 [Paracoccaceae bacterium]
MGTSGYRLSGHIAMTATFLSLGALSSGAAWAQDAVLLQCEFPNGKGVVLSAHENGVSYRFGHPGQSPDLALERPYAEVVVTPWPGVGGAIWEELRLTNGDVSYVLWGALDRMTDDHEMTGGIVVERNGKELARFDCVPETLDYTVFGFSDAYEAAGYCWDSYALIWKEDCE